MPALTGLGATTNITSLSPGRGLALTGLESVVVAQYLPTILQGVETPIILEGLGYYKGELFSGVASTSALGSLGTTKSGSLALSGVSEDFALGVIDLPNLQVQAPVTPKPQPLLAYIDYTTLTSTTIQGVGSWAASLPLENALNTSMGEAARVLSTTATMSIDIASSHSLDVVAIPKHNLTDQATWRVRMSNDATLLTDPDNVAPLDLVYDNGSGTSTVSTTLINVLSPPATIDVEADVGFAPGGLIKIHNATNNYILGTVDSYAAGVLTFTKTSGSTDPYASGTWTVTLIDDSPRMFSTDTVFSAGAAVIPPALLILPATVKARYLHVTIEDPTNALGYLDIYKVLASPAWQSSHDIDRGWKITNIDKSKKTLSHGAQLYIDSRPMYRKFEIRYTHMDKTEIMSNLLELDRLIGTEAPVLLCLEPLNAARLADKSIYGTKTALPKFAERFAGLMGTSISIEEWI